MHLLHTLSWTGATIFSFILSSRVCSFLTSVTKNVGDNPKVKEQQYLDVISNLLSDSDESQHTTASEYECTSPTGHCAMPRALSISTLMYVRIIYRVFSTYHSSTKILNPNIYNINQNYMFKWDISTNTLKYMIFLNIICIQTYHIGISNLVYVNDCM